jgi:hypothetical protein
MAVPIVILCDSGTCSYAAKNAKSKVEHEVFNLGFVWREKWCVDQLLKLRFGLPSSSRSPMRFTESLRIEAAAKTITPTAGSTKGMTLRADTKPAIFPARLRYLSEFMTTGGICQSAKYGRNQLCGVRISASQFSLLVTQRRSLIYERFLENFLVSAKKT